MTVLTSAYGSHGFLPVEIFSPLYPSIFPAYAFSRRFRNSRTNSSRSSDRSFQWTPRDRLAISPKFEVGEQLLAERLSPLLPLLFALGPGAAENTHEITGTVDGSSRSKGGGFFGLITRTIVFDAIKLCDKMSGP